MNLGQDARKMRKALGMSQPELALEIGCTDKAISNLETNKVTKRSNVYNKILKLYKKEFPDSKQIQERQVIDMTDFLTIIENLNNDGHKKLVKYGYDLMSKKIEYSKLVLLQTKLNADCDVSLL